MRTLLHAAFLAGLLLPVAGAASAADLDYGYDPGPPPPPVRVLPPRPFCGPWRPCFRRPWRLGFYGPRFARPFPPGRPEGYGYDYDRERYERANGHYTRYGYDRPPRPPRVDPRGEPDFGPRGGGYGPRDGYERGGERYGERRPYRDPLGHDGYRGQRGGPDRFDRGPGPGSEPDGRDDRGPYGRG